MTLLHRHLQSLLFAAILVGGGLFTLFGRGGVARRDALQADLAVSRDELAAIERDNQRLILELSALERDPVVVERAVADEIEYAREGATIYRFE